MKRILFIGHNAGRTGAPIGLLLLIEWLRARKPDLEIEVLLLEGGELEGRYRAAAKTYVMPGGRPSASRVGRAVGRLNRRFARAARRFLEPFRKDYDLVFGNTVSVVEHLNYFKSRGSRTVCWAHELEYIITSFFTPEEFVRLALGVDRFLVPSAAVESCLKSMGIERPIDVVYEVFPARQEPRAGRTAVRGDLGVSDEAFLVGGGGTVEWRKGVDLFLQTASRATAFDPTMRFVWIGGRSHLAEEEFRRVRWEVGRYGLDDIVTFTGMTDKPEEYLAAIDVFALTSREDPFPLISLEAASFGKPVICFEGGGGMPEFVESDAGAVVPYGDVSAFADQLLRFERDRAALRSAGSRARQKVETLFAPEKACSLIDRLVFTDDQT